MGLDFCRNSIIEIASSYWLNSDFKTSISCFCGPLIEKLREKEYFYFISFFAFTTFPLWFFRI